MLHAAIPAFRSANSKLESLSRCFPTPLVRKIFFATNAILLGHRPGWIFSRKIFCAIGKVTSCSSLSMNNALHFALQTASSLPKISAASSVFLPSRSPRQGTTLSRQKRRRSSFFFEYRCDLPLAGNFSIPALHYRLTTLNASSLPRQMPHQFPQRPAQSPAPSPDLRCEIRSRSRRALALPADLHHAHHFSLIQNRRADNLLDRFPWRCRRLHAFKHARVPHP